MSPHNNGCHLWQIKNYSSASLKYLAQLRFLIINDVWTRINMFFLNLKIITRNTVKTVSSECGHRKPSAVCDRHVNSFYWRRGLCAAIIPSLHQGVISCHRSSNCRRKCKEGRSRSGMTISSFITSKVALNGSLSLSLYIYIYIICIQTNVLNAINKSCVDIYCTHSFIVYLQFFINLNFYRRLFYKYSSFQ